METAIFIVLCIVLLALIIVLANMYKYKHDIMDHMDDWCKALHYNIIHAYSSIKLDNDNALRKQEHYLKEAGITSSPTKTKCEEKHCRPKDSNDDSHAKHKYEEIYSRMKHSKDNSSSDNIKPTDNGAQS